MPSKPSVDFKECLKDSPIFRSSLDSAEQDIEHLEAKLERLVKVCNIMIETGKTFKKASSDFIVGVRDLASYFKTDDLLNDDTKVSNCLSKFAHEMTEMLKYFTILLDQANRSVCQNIQKLIKTDIKKVKDSRKDFEKISDDLDSALNRNSNVPRTKVQECEEAKNILTAKRSCFAHASLDYVFQINVLHSKKRFDVLETMLSFMHAHSTYFHQGHDLFNEFDPEMKSITVQVDELRVKATQERREMEERHTLVQKKDLSQITSSIHGENGVIEGYLFKKTSKGFKSWVRRWFAIQNNQLIYKKRSGSHNALSIMEEDLRLCTVKPAYDTERRFCFEVLSPTRSHLLQADSDTDCQMWITEITSGISKAFKDAENQELKQEEDNSSPQENTTVENEVPTTPKLSKAQIRLQQLFSIPGNDHCSDCGSQDPRWASLNLGITLCIECSGIHRSFGVHLSKVRSITLDAWEPEQLKVMAELGNDIINRIFEKNVDETIATRATAECKRSIRESWIKAKYVQKAFVMKLPGPKTTAGKKIRGWSVKKKLRRSPDKVTGDQSDNELDVTSGLMEGKNNKAVMSVSTNNVLNDSDSGIGASASDVIVFGTDLELPDLGRSISIESSDESDTGVDEGEDSQSTTSWEDMSKLDPNMLLYKAAQARNLTVMLEALANGADPNWVNEEEEGRTPLMKAVETGSLSACEFLMLNGAKLDREDKNKRMPLHHAVMHGNTGQVCQFLKRGANLHSPDANGKDPLQIAVDAANADIVTLLRLAKLNEQMKEDSDMGNTDDTFNEVFRDFSNMASNNPELLRRHVEQTDQSESMDNSVEQSPT
ncbi:arf-GAP with coiled-coil, ANK repeat and PH domain-containing protein 2-like isoform X2 [Mytilus californianus]|uniref:arf-GAP with coiled-coil, ANK repeat and PH domain-containing protein 2-like isoform X2 n=1 Tax=Mytilus californianus TaxID=6549 RepID=UPI00224800A7|nr:arf-GAP with coiled-coil, ANK repeat and PH domain-containing protein 2-like isoform X2 [Mytilus californianus]